MKAYAYRINSDKELKGISELEMDIMWAIHQSTFLAADGAPMQTYEGVLEEIGTNSQHHQTYTAGQVTGGIGSLLRKKLIDKGSSAYWNTDKEIPEIYPTELEVGDILLPQFCGDFAVEITGTAKDISDDNFNIAVCGSKLGTQRIRERTMPRHAKVRVFRQPAEETTTITNCDGKTEITLTRTSPEAPAAIETIASYLKALGFSPETRTAVDQQVEDHMVTAEQDGYVVGVQIHPEGQYYDLTIEHDNRRVASYDGPVLNVVLMAMKDHLPDLNAPKVETKLTRLECTNELKPSTLKTSDAIICASTGDPDCSRRNNVPAVGCAFCDKRWGGCLHQKKAQIKSEITIEEES